MPVASVDVELCMANHLYIFAIYFVLSTLWLYSNVLKV